MGAMMRDTVEQQMSKLAEGEGRACACSNIRQAARAVTQLFDEALRPSGLRATQFGILGATMAMGPLTLTKLAEVTVTDRTTLTRNLKLLQKRGLIRIQTGSDRREREVTLTDRGREALAKGYPFWQEAQTHVVKGLGEERWKSLREGLSAVVSLTRGG
ncbi:MAG: MarR family winged helix-turn-helix transcriptional regulator [Candidatus Methylomirabilales bacterium]